MILGDLLLLMLAGLIYLGLGERILDRLGLTDKVAIGFIVAMIVGTFINIPLALGGNTLTINIGGLIPILLGIYVLTKASGKEVRRSLLGIVVTSALIFGISKLYIADTHNTFLDTSYLWAILAAVVAYLIGRSRRAAFVSAVLSIALVDMINFSLQIASGGRGVVMLGGAGILDISVLSGFLAVGLVELVGEMMERMHGGHKSSTTKKDKVDHVEYAGALVDLQESEKGGKKDE